MATYSDYDQHKLDEASGHEMDEAFEIGRRMAMKDNDRQRELLASLRSFERLIDAAERVVAAHGGLSAAIVVLADAIPKHEGRVG